MQVGYRAVEGKTKLLKNDDRCCNRHGGGGRVKLNEGTNFLLPQALCDLPHWMLTNPITPCRFNLHSFPFLSKAGNNAENHKHHLKSIYCIRCTTADKDTSKSNIWHAKYWSCTSVVISRKGIIRVYCFNGQINHCFWWTCVGRGGIHTKSEEEREINSKGIFMDHGQQLDTGRAISSHRAGAIKTYSSWETLNCNTFKSEQWATEKLWYTLCVGFPNNTSKYNPPQLEQMLNNEAREVLEK